MRNEPFVVFRFQALFRLLYHFSKLMILPQSMAALATRESTNPSAFDVKSTIPFWLDGKEVISSTTFDICSPLSHSKLYRCSSASEKDVSLAIQSARKAFLTWSQSKPHIRRDIFLRAAEEYKRRKAELRHYSLTETGASNAMFEFEHEAAYQACKDIAGLIQIASTGEMPIVAAEGGSSAILHEPFGVVLGIAPWNAPNVLGIRACLQPLAMYVHFLLDVFWQFILM